jgi:hypothetical protein
MPPARSPKPPLRRRARNKVLEIIAVLIFLLLMVGVVLPWAATYLSDGFVQQIENRSR